MDEKRILSSVPKEFSDFGITQLRDALPYIWRRSVRGDIEDALYRLGGEDAEYVQRMQKVQVYPPEVRAHFMHLTELSTPEIITFVKDCDEVDVSGEFERNMLHVDSESSTEIVRGDISNAGLLLPGRHPVHLLAEAIHTTPDRFILETRKYVGSIALVRTGPFFTEIIPKADDTALGKMETGITTKLTNVGEQLWNHIICYHIENDRTIPV